MTLWISVDVVNCAKGRTKIVGGCRSEDRVVAILALGRLGKCVHHMSPALCGAIGITEPESSVSNHSHGLTIPPCTSVNL